MDWGTGKMFNVNETEDDVPFVLGRHQDRTTWEICEESGAYVTEEVERQDASGSWRVYSKCSKCGWVG